MDKNDVNEDLSAKYFISVLVNITGFPFPVPGVTPPEIILGFDLDYDITVCNKGTGPLNNVKVKYTLDSNLEFISSSSSGIYDDSAKTLSCNLGNIAPSEIATLKVKVMPLKAGSIACTATATSDEIPEDHGFKATLTANVVDLDIETNNVNTSINNLGSTMEDSEHQLSIIEGKNEYINTILQGTTDSLLTQLKRQLIDIETQIDNFKTTSGTTFTTGSVIKDAGANHLIIAIKNSTNVPVTVNTTLINYTKTTNNKTYKPIALKANESQIVSLGTLPLQYEIIFEGVTNGIYVWTGARTNNSYDPLTISSFIPSNTFSHGEFIRRS